MSVPAQSLWAEQEPWDLELWLSPACWQHPPLVIQLLGIIKFGFLNSLN